MNENVRMNIPEAPQVTGVGAMTMQLVGTSRVNEEGKIVPLGEDRAHRPIADVLRSMADTMVQAAKDVTFSMRPWSYRVDTGEVIIRARSEASPLFVEAAREHNERVKFSNTYETIYGGYPPLRSAK